MTAYLSRMKCLGSPDNEIPLQTTLSSDGTTIVMVESAVAAERSAVILGHGIPDFDRAPVLGEAVANWMASGQNRFPPMAALRHQQRGHHRHRCRLRHPVGAAVQRAPRQGALILEPACSGVDREREAAPRQTAGQRGHAADQRRGLHAPGTRRPCRAADD